MIVSFCSASTRHVLSRRRTVLPLVFSGLPVVLCGCAAFNPAFVALFDSSGASGFTTLPNAPGHVVVAVSNQTEIDERLLGYLLPKMQDLSEAEVQALRPRIRMRIRITYVDTTTEVVEFQSGSVNLIDPAFGAVSSPDLNETDVTNFVAVCDVASLELEPGSDIEVFVPVEMLVFQLVETTAVGGDSVNEFEQRSTVTPQFRSLGIDEVDDNNNLILQRNIGRRDQLSPVPNIICGSVVVITVQGTLAVPFLEEVSPDAPSFDQEDEATVARIGGRYKFIVTVQ